MFQNYLQKNNNWWLCQWSIFVIVFSLFLEFLKPAFEQFWLANPNAKYAIVIDDEIIAKAGFIWYMGHALQAMQKDPSIGAASAWNPQGK